MIRQVESRVRGGGGRRRGAGRRRRTDELPHVARAEISPKYPYHVTIRVRNDVVSLRRSKAFAAIKRAVKIARERLGMRICHFAVLGNHAHFLVEAQNRIALGRAMRALELRIARALNRLMNREGPVMADRYHLHVLKTPTEVGRALEYLKMNARKHGFTTSQLPDRCSSWAEPEGVAPPRSWLLRHGVVRARPLLAA